MLWVSNSLKEALWKKFQLRDLHMKTLSTPVQVAWQTSSGLAKELWVAPCALNSYPKKTNPLRKSVARECLECEILKSTFEMPTAHLWNERALFCLAKPLKNPWSRLLSPQKWLRIPGSKSLLCSNILSWWRNLTWLMERLGTKKRSWGN